MPNAAADREGHAVTYPRFLWTVLKMSTDGSWRFYAWMTVLTAIMLVGANAWAHQVADGMAGTGMTDHVSWGLYIANFTFGVGLAAGAVMMVIPAYLYHDEAMHDVVLVGELLAIAAISVSLMFILVDMGRPDRFWHIIPGVGRFNWPVSMLTWDVIVLNGYLLLNLHIVGYSIYMRFLGRRPKNRWYLPFVFLSIGWAVSVHTVTAFLYSGLGGRPFWNSALLAPRFLASAFVTGPAFVIVLLRALRRVGWVPVSDGPIRTLHGILRVTVLVNLFMLGSEVFTVFYGGGSHAVSLKYLFFGLHGRDALVPWIWTAVACNLAAATLLHLPITGPADPEPRAAPSLMQRRPWLLDLACVLAFAGVWIEKGMGLIIPAFVPSTLHELIEYVPTVSEWKITAGIWALGAMVLTVLIKISLPVLKGELSPESIRPKPP